jgi:hypothetical protein
LPESILFFGKLYTWRADHYGLQMALKLMAAQIIHTPFYMTLDADLVLLRPLSWSSLVTTFAPLVNDVRSTNQTGYQQAIISQRVVYEHEDYSTHDFWWEGAKYFLGSNVEATELGFGVTPALLSTFGSLLTTAYIRSTIGIEFPLSMIKLSDISLQDCSSSERNMSNTSLSRLCHRLGLDEFDRPNVERIWLHSLGKFIWTEYTLYTITLSMFRVSCQC